MPVWSFLDSHPLHGVMTIDQTCWRWPRTFCWRLHIYVP